MTAQQTYDANDILMGGGGPPAAKFADPGTNVTGTIASPPQAFQEREYDKDNPGGGALKVFPSGDPIMGITIDLRTNLREHGEDDGLRRVYVQGRRLKETIRDAVRSSGVNKLEVGGTLAITFTHREDPTDKRSAKFYSATYTPAAQAAVMADQPPETPAPLASVPTPAPAPAAPTTPAPAADGPAQPTAAQLAAVRSAGVDPAAAFPHWNGQG